MKRYRKLTKLAMGGYPDDALTTVVGATPTMGSSINTGLIAKTPTLATQPVGGMAGAGSAATSLSRPTGGGMSAGAVGGAAALGTGLMDAIDSTNQYGNQSSGVTIGKGALSGAAMGATVGSALPGIGTAIGAAAGAIIGGVTGVINAKKIKRKERQMYADQNQQRRKYDNAVSSALSQDQGLVEGYKGASYYAFGGPIVGGPGGGLPAAPVRDLPTDNRRLRKIDSLATAWQVPTNEIMTTAIYNYGATKLNGGIPRRMDYVHPATGKMFYDYYENIDRGTTDYNHGSLLKFKGGGLSRPNVRYYKNGGRVSSTKEAPINDASPGALLRRSAIDPKSKAGKAMTAELARPGARPFAASAPPVAESTAGPMTTLRQNMQAKLDKQGEVKAGEVAKRDPKNLTPEARAAEVTRLQGLGYNGKKMEDLQRQKFVRDSVVNEGTRVNAMKANELRAALPLPRNAAQMVAKRVFGESRMDANSLSDNEKLVLWNTIKNAQKRTGKTMGGTEYEDYQGKWGTSQDFNDWFNKGKVGPIDLATKSVANTGFKVASTVGRGKYFIDPETGDAVYTDVYDWNTGEKNFKGDNAYQKLRNNMRGSEDKNLNRDKNERSRMNFILKKADMEALEAREQGVENKAMGGRLTRPGNLSSQRTVGGEVKQLNSNGGEVVGPSHANGGVDFPGMNAQLEGGETTAGNFVFSKELGFAKLHRPIAKAIGKIEAKPQTPDRIEALKLLKDREEQLALRQESFKAQNGIQ